MNKNRWIITGLLGVNLLLGVAVWSALSPESKVFGQTAPRNNYITVTGSYQNYSTIFILDTNTGMLAALRQDNRKNDLSVIGVVDAAASLSRSGSTR